MVCIAPRVYLFLSLSARYDDIDPILRVRYYFSQLRVVQTECLMRLLPACAFFARSLVQCYTCHGIVKMDSVQGQYMRINQMLMCFIGQWPYQETWEKFLIQIFFVPAVFSQAVIQGGGMITAWFANDTDAFMESSSPFVISLMCICKHINYTYNHEQMKRLMIIMAKDWNIYSKYSYEYDILCKSYAMGRKVTIAYAVSLYGSMTPFLVVPVLINTASYMGLYNISDGRLLMFRTEYFIDSQKYYYPLLVHSYIGTLGFVTIVVAIDSMLVFYIQHECGMCEILGYRLARIIDTATLDINLYPGNKEEIASYRNAKNCVIMHNHIIEYAKHLENANTTSYFFRLGFNMMGMTFTIFQDRRKMVSIFAESEEDNYYYAIEELCAD
ncbi:uncharacterized protein LOC126848563 isoform X2 [Cataglyphis hispanica]|uniref:uncharacterized protein LOC126848563 isoform X2 n=1 Tax=Cataglyphis hispanica TaxID=1086592 RepID=UPI0021807AF8|nr:uncharacterized protein LOC126848563 isoform X2 [Cataglyphis hispanica]